MNIEITHNEIADYLQLNHWVLRSTNYPSIDIYVENQTGEIREPIEIIVPNNNQVTGYKDLLFDALRVLSFAKNCELEEVALLVKSIEWDIHKFKLTEESTEEVSFVLTESLIECFKNLLSKVYQSVILENKGLVNSEYSASEHSDNYVQGCRFTHTFRGSFGVTIKTPLEIPSRGLCDDIPETVGRKVTRRVERLYQISNESVTRGSFNYIIDNIKDNKNDIKSLKSLIPLQEKIGVQEVFPKLLYSPRIQIEQSNLSEYVLNKDVLNNIYRATEPNIDETPKDITLVGFPETLHAKREWLSQNSLFGDSPTVTVDGMSGEIGRKCKLKFDLNVEQYRLALKAQEENRLVQVNCRVRKDGFRWIVDEVYSFNINITNSFS